MILDLQPGSERYSVLTITRDTLSGDTALATGPPTFLAVKQSGFDAEAGMADAGLLIRWAEFLKYPEGWPLLIPAVNGFLDYTTVAWDMILHDGRWWCGAKGYESDLDYLFREGPYDAPDAFHFQDRASFKDVIVPRAHIFAGLVRRRITPWGKETGSLMADYLCSIDNRTVAVSPGGVKPVTDWELNNVYVGVPVVQPDSETVDRLNFYLEQGRWQLPYGGDPGPRAAAVPASNTTVNIDAEAIASDLAVKILPFLSNTNP